MSQKHPKYQINVTLEIGQEYVHTIDTDGHVYPAHILKEILQQSIEHPAAMTGKLHAEYEGESAPIELEEDESEIPIDAVLHFY